MHTATLSFLLFLSCAFAHLSVPRECPVYNVTHYNDTSLGAQGLNFVVRAFRDAMGGVDNDDAAGPLNNGYRRVSCWKPSSNMLPIRGSIILTCPIFQQINWDSKKIPFVLPLDFFNETISKGLSLNGLGRTFYVSNPNPPPMDDRFDSILRREPTRQFHAYSNKRMFSPGLSNKFTVVFRIPGNVQRARVSSFGAVYLDVDNPRATSVTYLDGQGCEIAHVHVRARDGGLSFSGIIVKDREGRKRINVINKVVIKLGTVSLGEYDNRCFDTSGDLVVMDDLFYGEPMFTKPSPEPTHT